jgi:hypothetical protein
MRAKFWLIIFIVVILPLGSEKQKAAAAQHLYFDIKATIPRRMCFSRSPLIEPCDMTFTLFDDDRIFGIHRDIGGVINSDTYDTYGDLVSDEITPTYYISGTFDAAPITDKKYLYTHNYKLYLLDYDAHKRSEIVLPDGRRPKPCTSSVYTPRLLARFRGTLTIMLCVTSRGAEKGIYYQDVISYNLLSKRVNLLYRLGEDKGGTPLSVRNIVAGDDGHAYVHHGGYLSDNGYIDRVVPGQTTIEEFVFSRPVLTPWDALPSISAREPMLIWVDKASNLYIDMSIYVDGEQRFRLVKVTWTGQVLWAITDDNLGHGFRYDLVGVKADGNLILSRKYKTSDIAYEVGEIQVSQIKGTPTPTAP